MRGKVITKNTTLYFMKRFMLIILVIVTFVAVQDKQTIDYLSKIFPKRADLVSSVDDSETNDTEKVNTKGKTNNKEASTKKSESSKKEQSTSKKTNAIDNNAMNAGETLQKENVTTEKEAPKKVVTYDSSVTSKTLSLTSDYKIKSIRNLNNRSNKGSEDVIKQIVNSNGNTALVVIDNYSSWEDNCFNDMIDYNPLGMAYHQVIMDSGENNIFEFSTDCFRQQYHLNDNIASMLSKAGVHVGMSDEEAVRRIADYICDITTYNMDYATGDDILVYGQGRCSSYAVLMKTMANACGIQCDYVRGISTNNLGVTDSHAWNRVKVHGTYYYIDVCWMDNTIRDETYYLSNELWSDHTIQ